MMLREIEAKGILSKSKIYDYTLNAYVGCRHRCVYCYARFMKRYTGHPEPWGAFVDARINAPELLAAEIKKKKKGRVWVSGVCDAYQPVEQKYRLTGRCLEILAADGWPFTIQTKSPLVLRDIELLKKAVDCEVGFSITTADDDIRKLFEPGAPPIAERVEALEIIHSAKIKTFVMIAPMLPRAEGLVDMLRGRVDHVLIDRINYHYADWLFRKHGLQKALDDEELGHKAEKMRAGFERAGISCRVLF